MSKQNVGKTGNELQYRAVETIWMYLQTHDSIWKGSILTKLNTDAENRTTFGLSLPSLVNKFGLTKIHKNSSHLLIVTCEDGMLKFRMMTRVSNIAKWAKMIDFVNGLHLMIDNGIIQLLDKKITHFADMHPFALWSTEGPFLKLGANYPLVYGDISNKTTWKIIDDMYRRALLVEQFILIDRARDTKSCRAVLHDLKGAHLETIQSMHGKYAE